MQARIDRATIEGLAEHAYEERREDPRGRFGRDSARAIALGQDVEVDTDAAFPAGFDGLAVLELMLVIVRPSRVCRVSRRGPPRSGSRCTNPPRDRDRSKKAYPPLHRISDRA